MLLVLEADPEVLSVPERARLVGAFGDLIRTGRDPELTAVENMLTLLMAAPGASDPALEVDPSFGSDPALGEEPTGTAKDELDRP